MAADRSFRTLADVITVVEGNAHEEIKKLSGKIDMVFLDAVHTMEHTRACFEGYGRSLNPRFIVLDDIHLNASMARLWKELQSWFPADQVFDATEVAGRSSDCGFGVIEYRRG